MSTTKEMTVKEWQAAAQLLFSASDIGTVGLRKMTSRFMEGPWFDVAFDRGWAPLELLGYRDANLMGLVPLMHKHGLAYICGMDDEAADVMADMGPSQKIQRFILPREGVFWWRHNRFGPG